MFIKLAEIEERFAQRHPVIYSMAEAATMMLMFAVPIGLLIVFGERLK